jgi:hypothetical protein
MLRINLQPSQYRARSRGKLVLVEERFTTKAAPGSHRVVEGDVVLGVIPVAAQMPTYSLERLN